MHGLPPYPAPAGAPDLRPARRGGGGGVEVERRHTQATRQFQGHNVRRVPVLVELESVVMVHPLQEKVAEGLVGSEVEVFKEKVVVREVTGFTMMD